MYFRRVAHRMLPRIHASRSVFVSDRLMVSVDVRLIIYSENEVDEIKLKRTTQNTAKPNYSRPEVRRFSKYHSSRCRNEITESPLILRQIKNSRVHPFTKTKLFRPITSLGKNGPLPRQHWKKSLNCLRNRNKTGSILNNTVLIIYLLVSLRVSFLLQATFTFTYCLRFVYLATHILTPQVNRTSIDSQKQTRKSKMADINLSWRRLGVCVTGSRESFRPAITLPVPTLGRLPPSTRELLP